MDISKLPKGLLGGFYDTSPRTCISMTAEQAIPFGLPVMRGTDPERQVKRWAGAPGDEMLGVAAYTSLDITISYSVSFPQGFYPTHSTVTVLRKGKIWAPIYGVQTINAGDTAYINGASDMITNVKVSGETVAIGRFLTAGVTTGIGELIALELIPGFSEDISPENKDLMSDQASSSNEQFKNNKKSKK